MDNSYDDIKRQIDECFPHFKKIDYDDMLLTVCGNNSLMAYIINQYFDDIAIDIDVRTPNVYEYEDGSPLTARNLFHGVKWCQIDRRIKFYIEGIFDDVLLPSYIEVWKNKNNEYDIQDTLSRDTIKDIIIYYYELPTG